MIDKINGNGVYEYQSGSQKKNPAVKAYENTPAAKQPAKEKSAAAKSGTDAKDRSGQGVILDLSAKAAKDKRAKAHSGQGVSLKWKDLLRRLFAPLIKRLKDFWESDTPAGRFKTPQEENAQAQQAQEPPGAMALEEPQEADELGELPPLDELGGLPGLQEVTDDVLKSGDLERIERLLTADGTRRLAHNSDLLTYYDRRGKIVEMDESERYRVLFGDKNVLKL